MFNGSVIWVLQSIEFISVVSVQGVEDQFAVNFEMPFWNILCEPQRDIFP